MTSALSMGLSIAGSPLQPQRDSHESEPNGNAGHRQPEGRGLRSYELPDYQTASHKVRKLSERVAKSCPLLLIQS
jgi:hypothetical protein